MCDLLSPLGARRDYARLGSLVSRMILPEQPGIFPNHALIEERQHDQSLGINPVLRADVLRQAKIPLGFRHVTSVEVERRQTVIAREKLLRLARLAGDLKRLVVVAGCKLRPAV